MNLIEKTLNQNYVPSQTAKKKLIKSPTSFNTVGSSKTKGMAKMNAQKPAAKKLSAPKTMIGMLNPKRASIGATKPSLGPKKTPRGKAEAKKTSSRTVLTKT